MPALTPEQISEVKRLFAAGENVNRIRLRIGVTYDTVKRHLYEDFRLQECERKRSQYRQGIARAVESRVDPIDVAAVLATIPPDTRNLTARLLGDPLPGRSALDRRAGA